MVINSELNKKELSYCRNVSGQLFVDVSVLIHVNDGSGIQRVVMNILHCLLLSPPKGMMVYPVYRKNGAYWYSEKFILEREVPVDQPIVKKEGRIQVSKGDVFLGLDFDHRIDARAQYFLKRQQKKYGLRVYFVVYDLIAVTHPNWFNTNFSKIVKSWLHKIVIIADGLICISQTVAIDLNKYLLEQRNRVDVHVGFFHLGAEISTLLQDDSTNNDENCLIQWFQKQLVFLMVGTLEPRKGHEQVLRAMTHLWQDEQEILLVIVGKKGWNVEQLVQSINYHPDNGTHLFWFENVSDAFLQRLYSVSSVLLMASEGEGFGLPLVEAARNGLPIIARDLPVFREVAGNKAFYFSSYDAKGLADELLHWLHLYRMNMHPLSSGLRWLTWEESAESLVRVFLDERWIK